MEPVTIQKSRAPRNRTVTLNESDHVRLRKKIITKSIPTQIGIFSPELFNINNSGTPIKKVIPTPHHIEPINNEFLSFRIIPHACDILSFL